MSELASDARRIAIALLATSVCVALGAVLVLASDILIVLFLAILFAVFLTHASGKLCEYSKLSYSICLAIVTTAFVVITFGGLVVLGTKIDAKLDEASKRLDDGARQLEQQIKKYPTLARTLRDIPYVGSFLLDDAAKSEQEVGTETSDAGEPGDASRSQPRGSANSQGGGRSTSAADGGSIVSTAAGRVLGALRSTFYSSLGLVGNLGVIFFTGLFLAVDPRLYRNGFAQLFPVARRNRVKEIADMSADALASWLVGRFIAMFITGAGTGLALFVLGVPMPVTLGVITGLLTFIPNIGGLVALVLAALMALTQSPMTVLWVFVSYLVLQLIESNVVTPLVQQRQTSIPPALLIGFQVIVGSLAGFMGLMVATPLLAALQVIIKEAWIKDALGDES